MKYARFFSRLAAALISILIFTPPAGAVEEGYTVFHGDRTRPEIAITVDDCYNGEHVAEIVDLCEQYAVPVTFYVIGKALKLDDQALWQRALDAGCEIGNHTWGHYRLPDLTREQIAQTLSKTQEKLDKLLGYHYAMRTMRPPYGRLSATAGRKSDGWVVEAISQAGYAHAVRWDVVTTDPRQALSDTQNGSILLFHANRADVTCLQSLLPALLSAGYAPVTVSALLDKTDAPPQTADASPQTPLP